MYMRTKCFALFITSIMLIGMLVGCTSKQAETAPSEGEAAAQQGAAEQPADPAGPGAPPAGEGGPGFPAGDTFMSVNQLALGTLYLQGTEYPITADQASVLLPLWEQLKALWEGEDVDQARIEDVLSQINGAMTTEQTTLLSDLSWEDLAAWAQDEGYMVGFRGGQPGEGEGGPPQMSEEELATAQAARAQGTPPEGEPGQGAPPEGAPEQGEPPEGGPGQHPGVVTIDAVITMLEGIVSG
jgi:hypothetical protein